MRKTHPDRKDPIYCVLRSELRRSERALSTRLAVLVVGFARDDLNEGVLGTVEV